ncbi:MAG: transglutaminase domain-containing protein [Halieaceae bacterium]
MGCSDITGRFLLLAALILAVTACVSPAKYSGRSVIEAHPALLRGGDLFPADQALPELETVNLIAVNDDMRAFLDEVIPNKRVSSEKKTRLILRSLLDEGLNLSYNSLKTSSAEETFYSREGNCMSFTNLFIALAREAGVVASYQEVKVPPTWSAIGDTHYYYLHINSIVDYASGAQVVIDFDTRTDLSRGRSQHVGDHTAAAQYYNNMAVYYLAEADYQLAFLHARRAIELRPNTGYFWSNLGTIFKRAGELNYAEQAYLAAIDLSGEPAAVSNLARLYRLQGKDQLAAVYAEQAESFRARNPYYLFEMAEQAYEAGDYTEANRLLRSAVRKRDDEHEFYHLLGLTWAQLGDADKAQASFSQALHHASNPDRISLYQHKMQILEADH